MQVVVTVNRALLRGLPLRLVRVFDKYASAPGQPGAYYFSDLSPDDKRLLTLWNGVMWMVDLFKGSLARYAMTNENAAVFSPDRKEMAYASFGPNPKSINLYYLLMGNGLLSNPINQGNPRFTYAASQLRLEKL